MAIKDADRFPLGLLLDTGSSGWNYLLFSLQLDRLIRAVTSRGVQVDSDPRRLTPLVFRREKG